MCGHYKIGLKIASGSFRDIKGTNNIFHRIKNAKKSTNEKMYNLQGPLLRPASLTLNT